MSETIYVNICGPTLSQLIYENSRSTFEQEGFLVGNVYEKHVEVITDHDQKQVNVHKIIQVDGVSSCPFLGHFYNGAGKIDKTKIERLLGNEFTNIVGWFKFKRTSSIQFTLRERTVHKQLATLFNQSTKGLFTCCLSITDSSDNQSTHTFRQSFFKYNFNTNDFDQIPMHVINLNDPNNDYKSFSDTSTTFNNIVKSLNLKIEESDGLAAVTKIQNAAQKHLDNLIDEVAEAEDTMFKLEAEIQELQQKKMLNLCVEPKDTVNGEN